jgi:hypothetical protein
MLAKVNFVKQLARHILDIFGLRFKTAGSLYMSAPGKYHVGPLVDPVFYEVVAGKELFSGKSHDFEARRVWEHLQELRGPYVKATTWLAHRISAEAALYKFLHPLQKGGAWTSRHPSYCVEVMSEAVDLCWKYPGENPGSTSVNNPERPFSFVLENDLSNIIASSSPNSHFQLTAIRTGRLMTWETLLVSSTSPIPKSCRCGCAQNFRRSCGLSLISTGTCMEGKAVFAAEC